MSELTYTNRNGYQIPNIVMDSRKNEPETLTRYGRAREKYLMEHRKAAYTAMLLKGTLWAHLTEIDQAAEPAGRERDGGTGDERGRDGGTESSQSDGMGTADEQHPAESRGDRDGRPDLQLNTDTRDGRRRACRFIVCGDGRPLFRCQPDFYTNVPVPHRGGTD